jgi:hypothetical protein
MQGVTLLDSYFLSDQPFDLMRVRSTMIADCPSLPRPSPSVAPLPQKATAILTFLEEAVSFAISIVVVLPSKNLMVPPHYLFDGRVPRGTRFIAELALQKIPQRHPSLGVSSWRPSGKLGISASGADTKPSPGGLEGPLSGSFGQRSLTAEAARKLDGKCRIAAESANSRDFVSLRGDMPRGAGSR